MDKIKIGIVGLGNCASSLIQGINHYKNVKSNGQQGITFWNIDGYEPSDIEVVIAFDIDQRKVDKPIHEAVFAKPNCTKIFCDKIEDNGARVHMGAILDSVSPIFQDYPVDSRLLMSNLPELSKEEVVRKLRNSGCEILINYLPVGSEDASRFYADCALAADLGFVNCIPVFIANEQKYAEAFTQKSLPIIGDDIKAQIGATITHRAITQLCEMRGVKINRTYQLNTGGNTDFLNMLDRQRLENKKISKTSAVQSTFKESLEQQNIHIGPSDYVPWLKDNKLCYIRIEGSMFGDVPFELDLKLSVEDSPNSAGIVIDAIRFCKAALKRKEGGVLKFPSAYYMKHPPTQVNDTDSFQQLVALAQSYSTS